MTAEAVRDILKHPIVKKEPYQARVKCKLDTSGNNAVPFWHASGQICDKPYDLMGYKLIPKIILNHIWFMLKECEIVCLVTYFMCYTRIMSAVRSTKQR